MCINNIRSSKINFVGFRVIFEIYIILNMTLSISEVSLAVSNYSDNETAHRMRYLYTIAYSDLLWSFSAIKLSATGKVVWLSDLMRQDDSDR